MRRVDLIVNPISGQGAAVRAAALATRILEHSGLRVVQHVTSAAGQARAFAAALDAESDACIVVGGDGTLNEAIGGIGRDLPIGIIPVGTANVVSRDLRISRNPKKAAQMILEGTPRAIDVGRVNGRRFLAMVGAGFDGAVVQAIAEARHGPISKITYVMPALRALARFHARPLRLTVDGTPIDRRFFGVMITNTRNYGGYFSVTPGADIADGWLNWVGQAAGSRLRLLQYATAAAIRRELPPSAALYGRGREFVLEAEDGGPVPVQIDGDFFGHLPVTIGILPGAARLIQPPSANGRHADGARP